MKLFPCTPGLAIVATILCIAFPSVSSATPRNLRSLAERAQSTLPTRDLKPSELVATARSLNSVLEEADAILAAGGEKISARLSSAEELALLEAQAARLAALDAQIISSLDQIETKLRDAGLLGKVKVLDDFRSQYRSRISVLRARWESLGPNRSSLAAVAQARTEIARLRSQPESSAASAQPATKPGLLHDAQPAETSAAKKDTTRRDAPVETPLVQITPEIQALAEQLDRNPARIYAFVYNSIQYAQYPGYMQSPQAVLWSRRGNGWDQASLLIALMRAAGFQARYVDGHIRFTTQQWLNWWGAKTVAAAQEMAKTMTVVILQGENVQVDHGWAEVFVNLNDGQGERWIPLDPSFKTHEYQPGILTPEIAFDRTGFLAKVTPKLATEWYFDQIQTYLRTNRPGATLSNLPYKGSIIPVSSAALPSSLPFTTIGVRRRGETEFREYHHRVLLGIHDPDNRNVQLAGVELNLAEVCLKPITISSGPATAADAKTIQLFGGIENTPVFLVAIVPQIRVNDQVVASASKPIETGKLFPVRARIFRPFGPNPDVDVDQFVRSGENGAIALEGVHVSEPFLFHLVAQLLEGEQPLDQMDPDFVVRQTLFITGTRYNQRVRDERARLTEAMQFLSQEFRTGPVTIRAELERQNLLDRPFLVTHGSMTIGALGTLGIGLNLDIGNQPAPERLRELHRIISMTGVGLEHQIFEEIFLRPGMSATKGLQLSNERSTPIVNIPATGAAAEIAKLTGYPDFGKQLMQSWAAQGFSIQTPIVPVTYEGVQWVTFFAERADGGIVGELQGLQPSGTLTPVLKGGGTGTNPPAPQEPGPGGSGNSSGEGVGTVGDPVTLSNGNMFHTFDDFAIPSRGLPLRLSRTYNSQSRYSGAFGYGWTYNYGQSLKVDGSNAVVVTESGGETVLTRQGNVWVSSVMIGMRLSADGSDYVLRSKFGVTWRFNAAGKLIENADANGNKLLFVYSGDNLSTVTDALGRAITFSYDARNHITSVRDFTGRTWRYSYDDRDNLVSSADFDGNTTTYTYYASSFNDHNMKSITDPEGGILSYVYYADDKVFKTVNQSGAERRFFYLPFRNETQTIDERGFRTVYQYDARGRITSTLFPDGTAETQTWNADGLLTSRTDQMGSTTTYEYDERGNEIRVTDALGHRVESTYDTTYNHPLTFKDKRGNITRSEYDSRGNLVKVTDARGGEIRLAYDEFGQFISKTNAVNSTMKIRYGAGSAPIEIQDQAGATTRMENDSLDRTVKRVDPLGAETSFTYNLAGTPLRFTDATGGQFAFVYDRLHRLKQATNANAHTTRFEYDGLNNLTSVTDHVGQKAGYKYEIAGCRCGSLPDISETLDADGAAMRFRYNFRGQVIETEDSLGNIQRFAYDARGKRSADMPANGATVRYETDALHRTTASIYRDGSRDTFAYDVSGNMISASNANVTYTFTYDEMNRTTSVKDSRFERPLRYEYDLAGRRTRMTDHLGGVTSYVYDAAGRPTAVENPSGLVVRFSYDAAGRRSEMQYPNGVKASYRYDAAGRVLSIIYTGANGATIDSREYTYDPMGNRIGSIDRAGAHAYSYDSLQRLVNVTHPNQPAESYTYGPGSRRVSSHLQDALRYDAAGRLLEAGPEKFEHDASGNMTGRDGSPAGKIVYSYDGANRLARVSVAGQTVAAYLYDPLGRRIEKAAGGVVTRYTYDLANMLEEFDASGRVKAIYTSGRIDEPLVMQRDLDESGVFEPQEAFTYLSDALGSVVALADNTGAIRESYRYDAFGAVQPAKSALQNPFRFTGREWDEESGLYYYRARYYDTALGRFLQPDALWNRSRPVTLNRYVYVENNPVNLVDPSGLKPEDRVVFAWEHSTILGETISAQKVVVMRNGEMMPGYSRISIIDENTGQNSTSNWGILNLNNGQMLSGKIPMTAAESRNMRMANLEQFNNPFSESAYIMNSVMSTPGAIYDTVVDMGVSAGLLDAPRN